MKSKAHLWNQSVDAVINKMLSARAFYTPLSVEITFNAERLMIGLTGDGATPLSVEMERWCHENAIFHSVVVVEHDRIAVMLDDETGFVLCSTMFAGRTTA
jgi:hypothetical protein